MSDTMNYFTFSYDTATERFNVYGWSTYGHSSVLAGQAKKVYLDSFETIKEAHQQYPSATGSNQYMEPQISVNHLPEYGDIEHFDDGF